MKHAFTSETSIRATTERVWATLTDWELAHRWMPGIDALVAQGPTAPGTRLVFETRGRRRPARITTVDDGRRLVVRSTQGSVTADYRYELEPAGEDGTTLRLVASCDVRGPLAPVAPVLRRTLRRTDGGQPDALRAIVEG